MYGHPHYLNFSITNCKGVQMFHSPLAAIHERAEKKSITVIQEFDAHRHHSAFLSHNQYSSWVKIKTTTG